nr:unnamed protein product [Callosobruchus chinensis]
MRSSKSFKKDTACHLFLKSPWSLIPSYLVRTTSGYLHPVSGFQTKNIISETTIQQAYKEYIRDVVIYMSTARNDATKFGNDIFSYEKRIAEITPDRVT